MLSGFRSSADSRFPDSSSKQVGGAAAVWVAARGFHGETYERRSHGGEWGRPGEDKVEGMRSIQLTWLTQGWESLEGGRKSLA